MLAYLLPAGINDVSCGQFDDSAGVVNPGGRRLQVELNPQCHPLAMYLCFAHPITPHKAPGWRHTMFNQPRDWLCRYMMAF
jgi:hypothetical protein